MADPPTAKTHSESTEDTSDPGKGEEELILVKDGYFRYIDILFEWCKYMNPWQKNAVKALLNGEALCHPDHPLHQPGQDGIELYISTVEGGRQNLLFSLKQIEYLQYYIHHFSLADPRVVKELTAGGAIDWPEECNFDDVKVDNWIPLPLNVLLPEVIGKVEPVVFKSLSAIKKEMTRISKYNKHVKREAMMMRGTDSERNQAQAEIDNEREGPGLRRGPMRKSRGREEGEKADIDEGWGQGWHDEEEKTGVTGGEGTTDSKPPSLVPSDGTSESDSRPPSALYQTPDTPSQHYYHAQQALLLASQGGLVTALAHRPDGPPEGEPTEDQAKIGRILFMALDLVTWEKDESVILEIGWSAVYWQPVDPEEPFGEFEEMTDKGHYIVQDHLLQSKNGEIKLNHRDNYVFGNSLPIKQDDIALTVEKLIADLSKRAGGGPTYMVLHSPKGQPIPEHARFIQLGLFSVEWIDTLRPTVSEFPPYADESGLGQTFIIDTANLFGNIENGLGSDEGPTKTAKSLDDVAQIMFGESGSKPVYTANAGNRASYLTEVFLSIVTGPELKELQEDYKQSQSTAGSKQTDAETKPVEQTANEVPTFVRPDIIMPSAAGADSDSDSEEDEDGIKGVYFEDDDGELAEYQD